MLYLISEPLYLSKEISKLLVMIKWVSEKFFSIFIVEVLVTKTYKTIQ